MNNTLKLAGTVLALALSSSALAVTIVGQIHVNSLGGTAAVDTSANTVMFTPVAPANNSGVAFTTGDWTNVALSSPVSYANFTYQPLSVNAIGGWAPNTVWRIDANSYFTLTSITLINEGAGLVLEGLGVAYHDSFQPTPGFWSFSADASGAQFAFSSTAVVPVPNVPEGGVTAALLGFSMLSLGFMRRFFGARS